MNETLEAPNTKKNILREDNCKYCSDLLNQNKNNSHLPWNTILFETENFVVVPTLGSLVEGWILIVPKDHYICMGAMPKSLWPELLGVKNYFNNILTDLYGPITLFEHGPHKKKLSIGCGIDHAHLHLVPLNFNLLSKATNESEILGNTWSKLPSLEQTADLYNNNLSYIYIEDPNSSPYCCTLDSAPCQLLRKLIAKEIGIESQYDYKEYEFKNNVVSTIEKVKSALDNY